MTYDNEMSLLSKLDDAPVIYVDDEPDYGALFRARAERLGIKAVIISDSLKVVPALIKTRHRAKLLVTDLQMPKFDGLDLVKELKAIGSALNVVIVTANPTSERALEAKSLGFDIRKKPTDAAGFRDLLAPVLGPG